MPSSVMTKSSRRKGLCLADAQGKNSGKSQQRLHTGADACIAAGSEGKFQGPVDFLGLKTVLACTTVVFPSPEKSTCAIGGAPNVWMQN